MSVSLDTGFEFTDPQSYVNLARRLVGGAIGTGSPAEQIVSSLIIAFGAILSSSVTLGATLLIALPALFILLPLGLLRLLPPVERRWPL